MSDKTTQSDVLPGDELARIRNKGEAPIVAKATSRDRGIGPFKRLVLRGATVIDGTGAPPIGPTDIVVENDRIISLKKVAGNLADAGQPAGRRRSRDRLPRQMGDAGLHRLPRPCRRRLSLGQRLGAAGRLCLQALAGARRHHGARDGLDERPGLDARPEASARRRTRSRRRACSPTPTSRPSTTC